MNDVEKCGCIIFLTGLMKYILNQGLQPRVAKRYGSKCALQALNVGLFM
jgi:hypothetical protein